MQYVYNYLSKSPVKKTLLVLSFFLTSIYGFGQAFITTWKTDNPGTSNSTSITIPTYSGETYNYDVDWDNDGVFDEFGITGDVTHDYGIADTVTIRIQGIFPRIYFFHYNTGDNEKILSIEQWGNIAWTSMERAFSGTRNLVCNALDSPNLTGVTNMYNIFYGADSFTGDLSNWDVSNVTNMQSMFRNARLFNGDLSSWDVSNVTNMGAMFNLANSFTGDLSNWDVSNVTNMQAMFSHASLFNGDISDWDVSNVTNMQSMFGNALLFNGDLSSWDMSNVTNAQFMFGNARLFNGDLSSWDVSNVTNMQNMFYMAISFNGDLSNWDVSNLTNAQFMFRSATSFNGNLTDWDVSNLTNARYMFRNATSFNRDLSDWDVDNVTNMEGMFFNATSFNQNLGDWIIHPNNILSEMLNNSALDVTNYDSTLIGWENQMIANRNLGSVGLIYCDAEPARNSLINTYGWVITGDAWDIGCSPLSVETKLFDALLTQDNDVRLYWQTNSERNNSGFEIQKSEDGNDWEVLGFVAGRGTTHDISEYQYDDLRPYKGINYYRFKQIDFNGDFEYSKVVSVFLNQNNQIEIYPNPTEGNLKIIGLEEGEVKVFNSLGKMVKAFSISTQNIDISELPDGLYFISLEGVIIKRIIKR